ncbi:hypothetical protein PVOR_27545 [Paenibacillus vortex V453]|uniref:Uncharacterized protein n=1 Tax=Paenibacillus vortex V453 TaxID=715225 RepID=A0A2R9SNX5_9BACL|nr:hypothetical protein PVOR_27545 [Paenibacillus vortex V453]
MKLKINYEGPTFILKCPPFCGPFVAFDRRTSFELFEKQHIMRFGQPLKMMLKILQ